MALTDRDVINFLWTYGHFCNPRFPRAMGVTEADLPLLTPAAPAVQDALMSYQALEPQVAAFCDEYHARPLQIDGEIGPATRAAMEVPRCGHPDYGAMEGDIIAEAGSGNWLGCHGADGFHRAVVRVMNSPPSHLLSMHNGRTIWEWVKYYIWRANAEMGCDLIFQDPGQHSGRHNMTWSFVNTAASWIGLAIIGSNRVCSSDPIWSQYQSRWMRGAAAARVIHGWVILGMHELAHNMGWMYHVLRGAHASSGIMAPAIGGNLPPMTWRGDPAERGAVMHFGGKPIPGFDDHDPDAPPREEIETWGWTMTLTDAEGKQHDYEMTMRGSRVMVGSPMYGTFSGDWGKGQGLNRHQVIIQPRM